MKYRTLLRRARLCAMLPLIAFDCLGCLLLGGSWRNTISSEAWNNREQKNWRGRWKDIDAVFGKDHCQRQAKLEAAHAGVWRAWAADWNAA